MKGLVIINAYPNGEKFIRQGKRIQEALTALGADVQLVKNGELYAVMDEGGNPYIESAKACDFAIYLDKDKYLGRALEQMGVRLFNSAESVELCDDKLRTYQALAGKGISLCRSIPAPLCYTPSAQVNEIFLKNVGEELGYPLVAKKSYGSFGNGVQLVHGYPELCKLAQDWIHTPHFYQAYIAKSCGRDIRALVIGGNVVAAMERVAQAGEFRSNIELGGTGRKVTLSEEYIQAAEATARVLKLDYCGVDLLTNGSGVVVCEVNSNAFFEGIEGVTGIDIARLYAEHVVSVMEKRNKVEN